MRSLLELKRDIDHLKKEIEDDRDILDNLNQQKKTVLDRLNKQEKNLYEKNVYLCHIKEIFRLAKTQFSRLRRSPGLILTTADVKELDKWVSRAKSEDGLKDIRNALEELSKYTPSEIKSNLYALVQKIIIEGPYKGVRK